MRICVRVADSLLERALSDLLRSAGHEVTHFVDVEPQPALCIVGEETTAPAPPGCATLVLRRTAPGDVSGRCSQDALRRALDEAGTVAWYAPLDPRALVAALGEAAVDMPASVPQVPPPDLAAAPYAWLVLDLDDYVVRAANEEARGLLDLPREPGRTRIDDLPLPGNLKEALLESSDGVLPVDPLGSGRVASWWTDHRGDRVVFFMRAPTDRKSQEARSRRSLAQLGRMAATLAHEIRNPLASLAGALDLLANESDPADRHEILEMAQERLNQMNNLLEQTLQLARPIVGPPEHVAAQSVIESAVSTMRLHPQLEQVVIEVDAPEEPIEILAYAEPLAQALTNLLLNAAQAQEGRGTVRVSLEKDHRRAVLRVKDEGPGVPPEKRKEIFRPFYTTKLRGTGLGLAEVRRVMEAVAGAVTVEDIESGACLRLEVPLASAR